MRCYSRNSTHTCNQWKFNTYNAEASCMLTHVIPLNPKDQDLADHAMNKLPPNLFFDFLKVTRTSKKLSPSLFPTGQHESELSPHFTLFSLKERARSFLSPFCQTHGSTH